MSVLELPLVDRVELCESAPPLIVMRDGVETCGGCGEPTEDAWRYCSRVVCPSCSPAAEYEKDCDAAFARGEADCDYE